MIAFGCPVTSREQYDGIAAKGIRLAAEPDSVVLARDSDVPPHVTYNAILSELEGTEDLEAVVLLHQDLEITDRRFCEKVRSAFEDPDVALLGIAGGRGVHSVAWWECAEIYGSWRWLPPDRDKPLDMTEWENYVAGSDSGSHEVDSVDGIMIVMSAWAARNLRFDEELSGGGAHGWDVDIGFQARAAGKKVMVEPLEAIHHHSVTVLGDEAETWIEAHIRFARKWEGHEPAVNGAPPRPSGWEERARLAEAEAAAARVNRNEMSLYRNLSDQQLAGALEEVATLTAEVAAEKRRSGELAVEVAELREEIDRLRTSLERVTASRSWRYTQPLRRAGSRMRREPSEPGS